jgi:hypothetical protein
VVDVPQNLPTGGQAYWIAEPGGKIEVIGNAPAVIAVLPAPGAPCLQAW